MKNLRYWQGRPAVLIVTRDYESSEFYPKNQTPDKLEFPETTLVQGSVLRIPGGQFSFNACTSDMMMEVIDIYLF